MTEYLDIQYLTFSHASMDETRAESVVFRRFLLLYQHFSKHILAVKVHRSDMFMDYGKHLVMIRVKLLMVPGLKEEIDQLIEDSRLLMIT